MQIKLDYPEEFLTSVHAHFFFKFLIFRGQITSIAFNSNKKSYGPYGNALGDYFSIKEPGCLGVKLLAFMETFHTLLECVQ